MILRILAEDAWYRIAACLRTKCRRAFLLVPDAMRLYTLSVEEASTSSSASFSIGGSAFPRRCALRRMPSQAFLLKKHFSGASACKICD